ncbi:MAG: hypothetical protein ACI4RN_06670 [Oscillospiraceae bacterium]
MNVLKASVLAACAVGIISAIAEIAAPESMKKQLGTLTAIVLILAVFMPFLSKDVALDLKSFENLADTEEYNSMQEEFGNMYLDISNENMQKELMRLIADENIDIENVVIDSYLNEYNSLEVKKVKVEGSGLSDNDKELIREIIADKLPDAEIEFSEDSESEAE